MVNAACLLKMKCTFPHARLNNTTVRLEMSRTRKRDAKTIIYWTTRTILIATANLKLDTLHCTLIPVSPDSDATLDGSWTDVHPDKNETDFPGLCRTGTPACWIMSVSLQTDSN